MLNKKELEKVNKALQEKISKGKFYLLNKELAKEMFMEDLLDFIKSY
tara:strand:+ start:124 stop:264 length:141 start_codon:yes stop_codon:yes gene_type:complete